MFQGKGEIKDNNEEKEAKSFSVSGSGSASSPHPISHVALEINSNGGLRKWEETEDGSTLATVVQKEIFYSELPDLSSIQEWNRPESLIAEDFNLGDSDELVQQLDPENLTRLASNHTDKTIVGPHLPPHLSKMPTTHHSSESLNKFYFPNGIPEQTEKTELDLEEQKKLSERVISARIKELHPEKNTDEYTNGIDEEPVFNKKYIGMLESKTLKTIWVRFVQHAENCHRNPYILIVAAEYFCEAFLYQIQLLDQRHSSELGLSTDIQRSILQELAKQFKTPLLRFEQYKMLRIILDGFSHFILNYPRYKKQIPEQVKYLHAMYTEIPDNDPRRVFQAMPSIINDLLSVSNIRPPLGKTVEDLQNSDFKTNLQIPINYTTRLMRYEALKHERFIFTWGLQLISCLCHYVHQNHKKSLGDPNQKAISVLLPYFYAMLIEERHSSSIERMYVMAATLKRYDRQLTNKLLREMLNRIIGQIPKLTLFQELGTNDQPDYMASRDQVWNERAISVKNTLLFGYLSEQYIKGSTGSEQLCRILSSRSIYFQVVEHLQNALSFSMKSSKSQSGHKEYRYSTLNKEGNKHTTSRLNGHRSSSSPRVKLPSELSLKQKVFEKGYVTSVEDGIVHFTFTPSF